MKPNFALSLSFDGLRLMHRVSGGWHLVGQVALDDADVTGALARLRDAADTLEPNGISTKLLIPNDQIKYIALDTTRAEDEDVREALTGATPYLVDDLVYDFAKGGGRTYVAAVARETLEEARNFANEHGFNPVSFAAVPEPFTFVGEAFFGATAGQSAERDAEPVIVIGEAAVDIPEPVVPDPVIPEPAEAPHDVPADEIEPDVPVEAVETDTTEAEPDVANSAKDPAPETEVQPEPDFEPEPEPGAEPEPAPMFASRLRADRSDGAPARPAPPSETPARSDPTVRRTEPPALAVLTGSGTQATAPLTAASRDADDANVAAKPITADAPDPDVAPPVTGEAPTALPPEAAISAASLTIEPDPLDDIPDTQSTEPAHDTAAAAGNATGKAAGAATAKTGMFASRRMARAEARSRDASAEKPKAAPRQTVFGARKQPKEKAVVGGKPRFLGLILTAILLLFMLAFAALAALSEDGIASWFGFGSSETQMAEDTPQQASEVAAAQPEDVAPIAETQAAAPDALAIPTAPAGGQVLSPEEAARIYAATGVWQRAPRIPLTPRTSDMDSVVFGSAPTDIPRVPASPLASASSVAGDALIATPIDPPPPDATFDFGEDGLIVATQEGTLTPDGILVIVGSPALNPPTRPGTVAPEITPQDQIAAVIPETAEPVADAPEGVIVIAGRPAIEPPVRTGTAAPAPPPEAQALATGAAPLLATDGVLVLAGAPPILPPVRPGTVATPVLQAPVVEAPVIEAPAIETPAILPEPVTPDTPAETLPEGLNVIVGSPPVLPPVRPGTVAAAQPTPPVETPLAIETPLPETLPEGLNVIAGSPPVLPPARPGTVAPQNDAALDTLSTDVTAALSSGTAQVPTANTPRPLTRPASIVQAAAAVANTPVLGALTTEQALAFRPRTRPAGLAPIPEPTPEPEVELAAAPPATPGLLIAPEIAAAVAAAAERPNPLVNPTALAVAASTRPDTRPRNMARIVERAQAAQARVATQVATVAPRTVAPSGPTASAVAQNATLDNAINLRDVNLIGIYGGSNDRRALVRLSNGRYQRVTVGDRLDGGRVTAISAAALSYTKRGQAITLEVAG